MATIKPTPPTVCDTCRRSVDRLQRKEPPTCSRCYNKARNDARAAAQRAIDNAHAEALWEDAQRKAAAALDIVDQALYRSLQHLGPVLGQPWRSRAACKGTPTEIFFEQDTTRAAALCAGCEVLDPCRVWAIGDPAQQGYVGGMTEGGRSAARKHNLRRVEAS